MEIHALTRDYRLSLIAQNKASGTVDVYISALACFGAYLESHHLPTDISEIRKRHIEGFIAHLLETRSEGTAHNRFRALRTFFSWCVSEEELEVSPMRAMRPPFLSEPQVPVVTEADLALLLRSLDKRCFVTRRDAAIIRLFADTGIRAGEMAGIGVGDIDLELRTVCVTGKMRRGRTVPFGPETALSISRYLRIRQASLYAGRRELWLGQRGPLTRNGINQMIRRRGNAVGIVGLYPHRLRHTFAHEWLSAGGTEIDLMRLAGWRSRQMLLRYAASAGEQRAHEAYRRIRG